jgi:alkanesulfonate monooxygenase SsuD/methylene tetrahydromethanopterin reductase-like flavin-dependent oxidoreductase (luciferase family)
LRLLWSQPFVTFAGRYHSIENVGLNRSPVKIPIWIGSENGEAALRRVAKYADGWMSLGDPTAELPRLRQYMEEAGRDPNALMVRGPLPATDEGPAVWIAVAKKLQSAGITHLNVAAPPSLSAEDGLNRVIEARKAVADALG